MSKYKVIGSFECKKEELPYYYVYVRDNRFENKRRIVSFKKRDLDKVVSLLEKNPRCYRVDVNCKNYGVFQFLRLFGKKEFFSIQILNNYTISTSKKAQELFPSLYKEVCEQDSYCTSSWYDLTKKAYQEALEYLEFKWEENE